VFISSWDVAVKDRVPTALRNTLGVAIAKRTTSSRPVVEPAATPMRSSEVSGCGRLSMSDRRGSQQAAKE
jgi:hypothetical protein